MISTTRRKHYPWIPAGALALLTTLLLTACSSSDVSEGSATAGEPAETPTITPGVADLRAAAATTPTPDADANNRNKLRVSFSALESAGGVAIEADDPAAIATDIAVVFLPDEFNTEPYVAELESVQYAVVRPYEDHDLAIITSNVFCGFLPEVALEATSDGVAIEVSEVFTSEDDCESAERRFIITIDFDDSIEVAAVVASYRPVPDPLG